MGLCCDGEQSCVLGRRTKAPKPCLGCRWVCGWWSGPLCLGSFHLLIGSNGSLWTWLKGSWGMEPGRAATSCGGLAWGSSAINKGKGRSMLWCVMLTCKNNNNNNKVPLWGCNTRRVCSKSGLGYTVTLHHCVGWLEGCSPCCSLHRVPCHKAAMGNRNGQKPWAVLWVAAAGKLWASAEPVPACGTASGFCSSIFKAHFKEIYMCVQWNCSWDLRSKKRWGSWRSPAQTRVGMGPPWGGRDGVLSASAAQRATQTGTKELKGVLWAK